MDEEPKQTYTAREIVLEFFPATHQRLVPRASAFRLERSGDGELIVRDRKAREMLRLTPVQVAGNGTTQLCCDLCGWSAPRPFLHPLRAEVAGSKGRRFRYVTACRDTEACEARRFDDDALEALLLRVG